MYARACCQHHASSEHLVATAQAAGLLDLFTKVARQVFETPPKRRKALPLDKELVRHYDEHLQAAVTLGYAQHDPAQAAFLRENVQLFAQAKTASATEAMSAALLDEAGNIRSWAAFKAEVLALHQDYNVRWLAAEYEHAVASAQMAARWQEFEPTDMLEYQTVGDERVRAEHRAWDGITRPADDAWWQTHYPPNGWNCFTPETEVLTPTGWQPIHSVRVGDLVIGGSGKAKAVEFVHLNYFNEHIVRLVSEKEHVLATPNHRFLTLKGWIRAENLKVGDILIQLPEVAPLNKIIRYVQHMRTLLRNMLVAVPCRTFLVHAFDSNTEFRQEDVNPIRSQRVAKSGSVSQFFKMVNHQLLAFSRCGFGIGMRARVSLISLALTNGALLSNNRGAKGSTFFKFKRHLANRFRVFFSKASSGMTALRHQFSRHFAHFSRCSEPTLMIANPLHFNSFSTFSWLYATVLNQLDKLRRLRIPTLANHSVSEYLPNVQLGEGFTDGQPLQQFNSLNEFFRNAFFHLEFRKIDSIEKKPYSGNVHNLSVKDDMSYITRIGIVHNCRCTVTVAATNGRITPASILPALPPPDTLFSGNVGMTGIIFPEAHPYFLAINGLI